MATPPETVATAIRSWSSCPHPLVVAIDGHGAAGKSTLADGLSRHLDVAVIHTDDFFRSTEQRNGHETTEPMDRYYDADRLRDEALLPLRNGDDVSFTAFDEENDEFREETVTISPASVIVLEGVSAASPALRDLVDRSILVHTPLDTRVERLRKTITKDAWDEDWLEAERKYFEALGPGYFDLTVSGS
jgi:uridine kinase